MIKDQVEQDLKAAMIAKNQVQLDALRGLRARVKNEEIAKGKDFGDEEVITIIGSEVTRRRDSIQAYTAGGRPELAAKEQQEIELLQKDLPEQLSEAEVSRI